ncbi:hypothetical protein SH611_09235 [Geminicoccaceae bacterium 1502E]|nr:hypothetical protein [Geminicoccaceae bacterium 1502E]
MLRSGLFVLYMAPLLSAPVIEPHDVIGTWVVDVPAFHEQVQSLLQEQVPALPAEEQALTEQAIRGAAAAVVVAAGNASVEFRPDGVALFRTGDAVAEAVWGIDETLLRLVRRRPAPGDVPINGTLDQGLLYLEPDRAGAIVVPLPMRRR